MKTFMKVVECGSLKKAAKALGSSVSTVSFQIKSLEEFYGAKLFKRDVNGIELTEEGKIVLKNIEFILGSIEEAKRVISNLKGEKITIASGMVGLDIVFSIQTLLRARYPDVEVKVLLKGAHECVKGVVDGAIDFAIVGDISDDVLESDRLFIEEIGEDKLVLIAPVDHPLAKKPVVTLEDVLKYPMIFLNDNYGITTSTKKALIKSGVNIEDVDIAYTVSDFFSKINAVSNGLGIAITSFIAACKACEVGLIKIRNIKNFESERKIYFVSSRLTMESDRLKEYAEFIVSNCRRFFADFAERCNELT